MLSVKPNCECCDTDLPPDSGEAFICSFECTFCAGCAARLRGRCANCGGPLAARPARPVALLDRYPPTRERTVRRTPCFQSEERAVNAARRLPGGIL
jgi:hypothetical protein